MLQGRLLIISSLQSTTALQFNWVYCWTEASRLQRNSVKPQQPQRWRRNSNGVTPTGATNAGGVDWNWPLSTNSCYISKTIQDHFVISCCGCDVTLGRCLILLCTAIIMYCMHEITAWKPRTIQPFLVAVLDFAVLLCRRYGHAFCRRLGMSPFWLSSFWFFAVLTVNPVVCLKAIVVQFVQLTAQQRAGVIINLLKKAT